MSESAVATEPQGADVAEVPAEDSIRDIIERAQRGELNADGEPTEPQADATAPTRDAQGRFASAATDAEDAKPADTPTPATEEPAAPVIAPPQAWSAAEKDIFGKLPREVQEALGPILERRESDYTRGLQDRAKPIREYEAIQEALAPFATQYRVQGFSDVDAVRMWATTAGELRRDPVTAIRGLMESFGVTPEHILGRAQSPTDQQPVADPALHNRLARIEQSLEQRERAAEQREQLALADRIEKFGADPKHPHFEAVRKHMGALMAQGIVSDMEVAYEMAVHANPETRAKVREAERAAEAAKAAQDAKAKAEAARKAATRTGGAPPLSNGAMARAGNGTVEEDIQAAIEALR